MHRACLVVVAAAVVALTSIGRAVCTAAALISVVAKLLLIADTVEAEQRQVDRLLRIPKVQRTIASTAN